MYERAGELRYRDDVYFDDAQGYGLGGQDYLYDQPDCVRGAAFHGLREMEWW